MIDENLQSPEDFLRAAAQLSYNAASACRNWENGGDSDLVGETAEDALCAAKLALDALGTETMPSTENMQSRRGRLAYAGWMLLLAGTDEDGVSSDLETAAGLLFAAADS